MGGTVVGRGAILIVFAGAYGPAAVALAASVEHAERAADRLRIADLEALDAPGVAPPLGLLRDRGEIKVVSMSARQCGKSAMLAGMVKAMKREAMPEGSERPAWACMNERHQRRAGLRSSRIPRVICPA